MRIAVCDDKIEDLEQTVIFLKQHLDKRQIVAEIAIFSHPDELLVQIKHKPFDIYLLDIIMPMFNGIEVGKEIRKADKVAKILYLTTSKEYAINAFSVQAINYLVKPYKYEDFEKAIDEVLKEEDYIILPAKDSIVKQNIKGLIYVESNKNYSLVYFAFNQVVTIRMTLQSIMDKLKDYPEFSMVGSSYIVNYLHIDMISDNCIFMDNDKTLPIPRRSLKEFRNNYFNYYAKETMR